MAHKEVRLEHNAITNQWNRRWYLHHGEIVEMVSYESFKSSPLPDVSKYDANGCL